MFTIIFCLLDGLELGWVVGCDDGVFVTSWGGWIEGCVEGCPDGLLNGWLDGWLDGCLVGWLDGCLNLCMDDWGEGLRELLLFNWIRWIWLMHYNDYRR
jgi:hypothetical protein